MINVMNYIRLFAMALLCLNTAVVKPMEKPNYLVPISIVSMPKVPAIDLPSDYVQPNMLMVKKILSSFPEIRLNDYFKDLDKDKVVSFVSEKVANNPKFCALFVAYALSMLAARCLSDSTRKSIRSFCMKPIDFFALAVFKALPLKVQGVLNVLGGSEGTLSSGKAIPLSERMINNIPLNGTYTGLALVGYGIGVAAGFPTAGHMLAGASLTYGGLMYRHDKTDAKIDDVKNVMGTNHTEAMETAEKNKKELQQNITDVGVKVEDLKKLVIDETGQLRGEAISNKQEIMKQVSEVKDSLSKNLDDVVEQMKGLNSVTNGKIENVSQEIAQQAQATLQSMKDIAKQVGDLNVVISVISSKEDSRDKALDELQNKFKSVNDQFFSQLALLSEKMSTQDLQLNTALKKVQEGQTLLKKSFDEQFSSLRVALESQIIGVSHQVAGIELLLKSNDKKQEDVAVLINTILHKSQLASDETKNLIELFRQHKLGDSDALQALIDSHKKVEGLISKNLDVMAKLSERQDRAEEQVKGLKEEVIKVNQVLEIQQGMMSKQGKQMDALMEKVSRLQEQNSAMQLSFLESKHAQKIESEKQSKQVLALGNELRKDMKKNEKTLEQVLGGVNNLEEFAARVQPQSQSSFIDSVTFPQIEQGDKLSTRQLIALTKGRNSRGLSLYIPSGNGNFESK